MKKLLLVIFIILLSGSLGAFVYSKYAGDKIYSQSDLDNAYQLGYETALPAETEYKKLIKELRQQIEILQRDLSISEQERTTQVEKLNEQIADLEKQLEAYENAWDLSGKLVVSFYADNEIYQTVLVSEGQSITTIQAPKKENYTFMGWLLDNQGEPIEDISTVAITSNSKYYATYEFSKFATLNVSTDVLFGEDYYGDKDIVYGFVKIDDLSKIYEYGTQKGLNNKGWYLKLYIARSTDTYHENAQYSFYENERYNESNGQTYISDVCSPYGANFRSESFVMGVEYKVYVEIFNIYEEAFSGEDAYQTACSQEIRFTYTGYMPYIYFNVTY